METDWICEEEPKADGAWWIWRNHSGFREVLAYALTEEIARTLTQRANG